MTGRILDLRPAEYHADATGLPMPSLSSSVAKLLVRRSPMHAWHAHPRLGGEAPGQDPTGAMDEGTVLHRLLLGRGEEYAALPFDDYRSKAAQEARDAARAEGKVPMLARRLDELREAAEKAGIQLLAHSGAKALFGFGRSEAAVVWTEGDVALRCLVDWLPEDPRAPWFDVKTVAQSADPDSFARAFVREHAFQAAFYLRAARHLGRTPPAMLFVVVERRAPYGVGVVRASDTLLALAEQEVERAVRLWADCLRSGEWPGYPSDTVVIDAPGWMVGADELLGLEEEPA